MQQYIALIWNNFDTYDRHYVRSNGEEKEKFVQRMRNCYGNRQYNVQIYVLGNEIN